MSLIEKKFALPRVLSLSFTIALLFWLSATIFAQTETISQNQNGKSAVQEAKKPASLQPVFADYRGVKIGMTADEVRSKINQDPRVEDKAGLYYIFSDNESAQISFDADKKVRMISIIFSGNESAAPKYTDVFGADTKIVAKDDGSIYKLVDYPSAGYWVAYSRSAGENPTIAVTMQKMRKKN